MDFTDSIVISLIEAQEDGNIKEFSDKFSRQSTPEELQEAEKIGYQAELLNLYKTTNQLDISWSKNGLNEIGGAMHLNPIKFLFKDEPSLADECDLDPETDPDLRHFRIFDRPTMNSEVGFFVLPNEKPSESIHFRMAGEKWTEDLDLNFHGYLEMALESKVFFHWQLVLVDIKNQKESKETLFFKKNIVSAFPKFDWGSFVSKYNDLRLSQKK